MAAAYRRRAGDDYSSEIVLKKQAACTGRVWIVHRTLTLIYDNEKLLVRHKYFELSLISHIKMLFLLFC